MNISIARRKAPSAPDVTAADAPADDAPASDGATPTLRSVSPEFAALQDKFEALVAREDAVIQELQPINQVRAKDGSVRPYEQENRALRQAFPPPPPAEPRAGALKLVGDLVTPPPPREPYIAPPKPHDAKFAALVEELSDVQEAIKWMRPELTRAHLRASRILCDLRTPEYKAIVARFTAALIALGDATREHDAFTRSIRNAAWSCIRPIRLPEVLGKPEDPSSELRLLLQHAAETGHFDPTTIPENWKTTP